MARSRESKIELTAYDDLFQTDESREEAKLSKIRDIPIAGIDEFPDHPFKVLMDEDSRLPPFRARGWRDSWRLHICRFRNDRYTEICLPSLTLPGNRRRPRTYQNIGLYVQLPSPSSCSARKKPRTSSSTLPAGCGREIACGSELFCSSAWRIAFKSFRNCSRCAC